jgi:aminopeptidase S
MRRTTVKARPALTVLVAAVMAFSAQPSAAAPPTRLSGQPTAAGAVLATPPVVDVNNVKGHLQQLQTIAGTTAATG